MVILVGAFSRHINHLDVGESLSREEKNILKALRINIKAAIDFGLELQQTSVRSCASLEFPAQG